MTGARNQMRRTGTSFDESIIDWEFDVLFQDVRFAHIAQSVEHFLGKEEVTGSIPVMGSRYFAVRDSVVFAENFGRD